MHVMSYFMLVHNCKLEASALSNLVHKIQIYNIT